VELWDLVRRIPPGRVTTYKELSLALGWPRGWRRVGRLLSTNPHPVIIPCHRVVCSDGRVGGYKLGVKRKIELLQREGVEVKNGRVDLEKYFFRYRSGRSP
jgi:O-6-methylguanine DNA methyltransferase